MTKFETRFLAAILVIVPVIMTAGWAKADVPAGCKVVKTTIATNGSIVRHYVCEK